MADIAIFRINYKSDFILTLQSDAGWMTPFCIKFWTGAPSQAYFAGWDGTTYTHCAVDGEDPTKLSVQFDNHHLPIGDLKFQIGYHFTVADFPTSVEDEVINQAAVIIDNDGEQQQVMLDFNGETAPEIEFNLPAYANEAQRIANEQARIAAEEQCIVNEQARISAEETRQTNEQQRINQETARVSEFARLKTESEAATDAATSAANTANASAQNADEKATLANQKAQLAADKAALAQAAATLADDKAQLAADKASLAQQKADYAQTQGNYAKAQGDAAKTEAETAHSLNEEVSHDESTRQQQETARQEAEAQRATDFNTQMQQQQTAYTEAEAARETAFNEAEQQRDAKVDEKVADITNLQAQVGYFVCDTAAATAAKTIAATGYVLGTGGNIRIKMTNANTADSATLNINSTGAKALFYNGAQASSTNSWEAGEVVEVYYDGTTYQASSTQGGRITKLLPLDYTVINDVAILNTGEYSTHRTWGYCITNAITLNKGDVIRITAKGHSRVAMFSKVIIDLSSYTPLLQYTQDNVEVTADYQITEDGQYAVCGGKNNLNIQIYSFGLDYAKGINCLNTTSGLSATNVQDAIDETVIETNERLLPLEKMAENNEFITKVTFDDLITGRCDSSVNIIGRATTLFFNEKVSQASYTQQVVKGQQFIVHNAFTYLNGGAYGYIIVNGGCLVEQFPQWQGENGGVVLYDIIITCKTNGTIYINLAKDGYILKIDERIKIKDDSQYENVDCELCTHSITVSDDAYGVNFWTTGMIDDNGVMWLSYQCGAANSGIAGEGNKGGMSHFPITKPWASESELTPHDIVIDDIAMNYPIGYIIKEITDDVIVRHRNYSIGAYGCICNWNKTQGTCVKNTITYDGNTVDYNLYNISQMLIDKGILEGSASGSNRWDYTRQVYADGYYWTMEGSGSSDNICPVILKSLDCVNWEYVGAIPSITHKLTEGGIAVKDGVMYAVWRKDGNSDNNLTEYLIYDLNNNTLLLDETNISGTINSRPSAFLYQENVYFVVNEISSIYNFRERRLQVAIYRVMPDYTLDRVYTLADANGINYHDVIVHGSYEDIQTGGKTYPHYATDQSVYMIYTSDRRHIATGGRKLSDIQLINITPCLQPKYAGMQRYVNWQKPNC